MRLLVAALAGAIGAFTFVLAAAVTYTEFWPVPLCKDVFLNGVMPACLAPAAPWWVLLLAGLLGCLVFSVAANVASRKWARG
ncbi:MAG: hypothetical protein GEU96_04280 [Propionibacteriales bacterium]|nr:hypothetical protein [Propionibacteriales bacterium]